MGAPRIQHDDQPDGRSAGRHVVARHARAGRSRIPKQKCVSGSREAQRIVYAHSGARKDQKGAHFLSTWTFDPAPGGKTVVTIRQVYDTPEDREMIIRMYGAIEGGHQTLGRLNEEMSKIPVVVERTLAAPMDKVGVALTNLAEMKQWYFPQLTAFEPRVGFETQFTITMHEVDYPHLWRVTEVQPGKRITYSWKYGGYSGESFVTFELSPAATGTHLTLTHRDLETFEPDKNPMMVRSNFVMGWNHFGDSLMSYSQKQSGGVEDFVISRVFDAPRQRVWDAWTKESEPNCAGLAPRAARSANPKWICTPAAHISTA